MEKSKNNIPRYIIIGALLIIFLIAFCIRYVSFIWNNENDNLLKYEVDTNKKNAIIINNKINGYIDSLVTLSSAITSHTGDDDFKSDLIKNALDNNAFKRIGFVLSDGSSYIEDNKLGVLYYSNVNLREREYYRKAIKGERYVSAPSKDQWSNESVVIISVPIYDANNKIIGILAGVNNTSHFIKSLENDYEKNHENTEAFFHIVSSDGNIVFRSTINKNGVAKNIFEGDYEYIDDMEKLKSNYSSGKSGITKFKLKGIEERYSTYTPININDWYLTSVIPVDSIKNQVINIILYTVALMVILSITLCMLIFSVINIHKKNLREKYALAFKDSLTGCYNKTKFIIELQNHRNLYDDHHAVLMYDIKNFKAYNNIFGYQSGDELIIKLGRIFSSNIKSDELVSRIYAERFILLVDYSTKERLNNRINYIFKEIGKVLNESNESQYTLIARCGVCLINEVDTELTPDTIIDYANQARIMITDISESTYNYFDFNEYTVNSQKAKIESHMQTALENNEFLVYLQPKYSIVDSEPTLNGAESLVRWRYKNEKFMFPNIFIPTFEQNGFITKLDLYMLEHTCKILRKWLDEGKKCVPISVNQSRANVFNSAYLTTLLEIIDKYEIPHELLEFEITESAVMDDIGQVREHFRQLRNHGFLTSMDDFGSGFSSLNMLKDIEADIIKIDKGFFDRAFDSVKGKYIVKTVISLVKGLGYRVIAEGIETKKQLEFLKTCGCDSIQGYYFGKPQPWNDFENEHLSKIQESENAVR